MSFPERSLLFAKLSSIAYNDNIKEVKKQVKKLGFTTVEFYNKDGAQAYRFHEQRRFSYCMSRNTTNRV